MSCFVYMIELENGSYYTGFTTDLRRRFLAHGTGNGARITRSFRPVRMLAAWSTPDRSTALRLEAAIKKLSRQEKTAILTDRAVGRRFGLIGVRRIKVPEINQSGYNLSAQTNSKAASSQKGSCIPPPCSDRHARVHSRAPAR